MGVIGSDSVGERVRLIICGVSLHHPPKVTPAQKLRWGAQHFSALPVPSGTTPRILFVPFVRHRLRLFFLVSRGV